MDSPYTNCRKCRQPILIAESWAVGNLCPSCCVRKRMEERYKQKQKLPEYRVKIVDKKEPLIRKDELFFILTGILGLIGLYLLVIG